MAQTVQYRSGDREPDKISVWRITFNEQSWLLEAIQLALSTLSFQDNWTPEGDVNQDDSAEFGIEAIDSFFPAVDMIATVLPFAGDTAHIPDGSLLCDGSSYLRSDWPDLFAIIGTIYGSVDGTHFNVPNIPGRTVVGAGSGSGLTNRPLASIFGEETHQLTTPELASHNHAIDSFTPTAAGLEVTFASLDTGLQVASTGNTGGNQPHNNMQPSIALNYIIVAVHG